jgi:hypothetical protein
MTVGAGGFPSSVSVILLVSFVEPEVCALEGSSFPSRAGASGSYHLPWALPRILQVIPKSKRVGGSDCPVRGSGAVC